MSSSITMASETSLNAQSSPEVIRATAAHVCFRVITQHSQGQSNRSTIGSRGATAGSVLWPVWAGAVGNDQDQPRSDTTEDVNDARERFRPVEQKKHHWNIEGRCHDIALHADRGSEGESSPIAAKESEIMV